MSERREPRTRSSDVATGGGAVPAAGLPADAAVDAALVGVAAAVLQQGGGRRGAGLAGRLLDHLPAPAAPDPHRLGAAGHAGGLRHPRERLLLARLDRGRARAARVGTAGAGPGAAALPPGADLLRRP